MMRTIRSAASLRLLLFSILTIFIAAAAAAYDRIPTPRLNTVVPAIDLETYIVYAGAGDDADTPPGPTIPLGMPIHWDFQVTNIGTVPLPNIAVTDDRGGVVTCPRTTLEAGETMVCTMSGVAMMCQQMHVGTATAETAEGMTVSDSDPTHYFGEIHPQIGFEASVNGEEADTPPGPVLLVGAAVHWTYVVTNMGDVNLAAITVTDDRGQAVTCPKTSLAPGESMTCTAAGIAIQGQYMATATVDANPPCGAPVTATDAGCYLGVLPSISLEVLVNGFDADTPPGPSIDVGAAVLWTYVVTNTGEVPLTTISVTDDHGVAVTCPKTTLQPGESMTCTASGTAVAGQYGNVGTAAGSPPAPPDVSATDPSFYFGVVVTTWEGCASGYWKKHTDSWPPTGYSPSQMISGVFPNASLYPTTATARLIEALNFSGRSGVEGAARILLRAAVTALLNASHPSIAYPRTEASVIAEVNAALASGNRSTMLSLQSALDADNAAGCPLR